MMFSEMVYRVPHLQLIFKISWSLIKIEFWDLHHTAILF